MNNYFMETHHHEWILTNKKGGYALGTGNLINQRKYHGLLVAGSQALKRTHLVAGIEEKVEWRGETIHLDSNNYSNCIYPEGFLYLVKPWLRPYPIFLYSALPHQNEILIMKEIFMSEHSNTIVIRYTNLGQHTLHLELHPKYTMHDHHELNKPGSLDSEAFETEISDQGIITSFHVKRLSNNTDVFGYSQQSSVINKRLLYYNVFYPWDAMKGYSGIGDQIALFEIQVELNQGTSKYIVFSDVEQDDIEQVINQVVNRYNHLSLPHDYPGSMKEQDDLLSRIDFNDGIIFNQNEYLMLLEFIVDDFLLETDVIAGYPWYGIQSADTMYFLNALLYNPVHKNKVEQIVNKYIKDLETNLLHVYPAKPLNESNPVSLEATLMLIQVLYKLYIMNPSKSMTSKIPKIMGKILMAIKNNKTYPFEIRNDGLINFKSDYSYNTWMNAVVDNKPATPRSGAPIEINAMWYNALEMYNLVLEKNSKVVEKDLIHLQNKVTDSFHKYTNDYYPADRLIADEPVKEIRPNALIASALPKSPLKTDQMEKVFDIVFKDMYTFYGIRTLHPQDSGYKKKYYGIQRERDIALFNGSVLAWLLGPFCDLYIKINLGKTPSNVMIKQINDICGSFRNSFLRGHISSVAEIWDGDKPHFPKGSPAYARSVASIYMIEMSLRSLESSQV
jgi:predicted glycogen debranching enzyme